MKFNIFGILSSYPPSILSIPTTLWPKEISFSLKCDPRNPATPVTKIFWGIYRHKSFIYKIKNLSIR